MTGVSRNRIAVIVAVVLVAALTIPGIGFAKGVRAADVAALVLLGPDSYESDDTTDTAVATQHGGAIFDTECADCHDVGYSELYTSYRTFDATDATNPNEEDWVMISAEETGQPFMIETEHITGWANTNLTVYPADAVDVSTPTTDAIAYNDDLDDDGMYSLPRYGTPRYSDSYESALWWTAPAPGDYYLRVGNVSDYSFGYNLHLIYGTARRVSGENRYDTAARVSKMLWGDTSNPNYGYDCGPTDIIVASGVNPADALSGVALASQLDGVLLLTKPDMLPMETAEELERLTAANHWDLTEVTVWVLGGPAAVSDDVLAAIGEVEGVYDVQRIAGATRYETAAEIATVADTAIGVGATAYVVNGKAWADALAVGPIAAWDNSVVLLSDVGDVPDVTMDWLTDQGVTDVVVVGGEAVVNATAFDELDASFDTTRVAGATRYETARKIAQWGVDMGMRGDVAQVVSGKTFADALPAGVIGWYTQSPLLLTPPDALSAEITGFFDDNGGIGPGCYVVGGPAAVTEDTYNMLRNWWQMD